jgi:hypothetical protein
MNSFLSKQRSAGPTGKLNISLDLAMIHLKLANKIIKLDENFITKYIFYTSSTTIGVESRRQRRNGFAQVTFEEFCWPALDLKIFNENF